MLDKILGLVDKAKMLKDVQKIEVEHAKYTAILAKEEEPLRLLQEKERLEEATRKQRELEKKMQEDIKKKREQEAEEQKR